MNHPRLAKRFRFQTGQAMLEMGIVLPLLLVLFLAVGYFGHAVISLQNLHAASRAAARAMAQESTATPGLRRSGSYDASEARFLELSQKYLQNSARPEQLSVRSQTNLSYDYNSTLGLGGRFDRLGEHRFAYVFSETVNVNGANSPTPQDIRGSQPANLNGLGFGLGAVYYGGTLQYSLDELTPLSRFIFRFNTDPVLKIGATSLMPAELPLRGSGYGLLDINPGIANLINGPIESSDYPDLIEP